MRCYVVILCSNIILKLYIRLYREPLLIVSHQGILRIIHAFYTGLKREDAPYVSIPLNTVVQLTPTVYGCVEKVSLRHMNCTCQKVYSVISLFV